MSRENKSKFPKPIKPYVNKTIQRSFNQNRKKVPTFKFKTMPNYIKVFNILIPKAEKKKSIDHDKVLQLISPFINALALIEIQLMLKLMLFQR